MMLDSGPHTSRASRRGGDLGDTITVVLVLLLAPVAAYAATRAGIELANRSFDTTGNSARGVGEPLVGPASAQLLAIGAGVIALLYAIQTRFLRSPVRVSWATAASARPVGEILAELPGEYHVIAGASVVDDGDLVDHVVIGPTGVFTIEARAYNCGVVIEHGRAFVNGRSLDDLVAQVSHAAGSIGRRVRNPVTPIVCAQGGVRVETFLGSPVVDGVRFCDERHLIRTITAGRSVLSEGARDRIELLVLDR